MKSTPAPGVRVMLASMSACSVAASRAQGVDGLLLGHPGRDLLADDPVEQDVRGIAQDLRADHGAGDAQDRERDDDQDPAGLGPQGRCQAPE